MNSHYIYRARINRVWRCVSRHSLAALAGGAMALSLAGGCTEQSKTSEPITPDREITPSIHTPAKPMPIPSFSKLWREQVYLDKGDLVRALWVKDDSLYMLTSRNNVFGLKRSSGELLFKDPIAEPGRTVRSPVVLTDKVVFPTNSTLEVYSRRGRFLRSINCGFSITSNATGEGSDIFVGDDEGGGRLACVDVSRPYAYVAWTLMLMGPVTSGPIYYQGSIYASSDDGGVRSVSDDRAPTWPLEKSTFQTYGKITADLKADDYGVYVASNDHRLYCIDRGSGRLKWQYFSAAPLVQSPDITAATVYQMVPGVGLVALDKIKQIPFVGPEHRTFEEYNRNVKWINGDARQFLSDDDKYTYVQGLENNILALDKATGKLAFQSWRKDFVSYGVNTKSDGIIYAATGGGAVLAIRPNFKPGMAGELVLDVPPADKQASAN